MWNVDRPGVIKTYGPSKDSSISDWKDQALGLLVELKNANPNKPSSIPDNFARAIPEDEIAPLVKAGSIRVFQPGEPVALKGQEKSHELVIIQGEVR